MPSPIVSIHCMRYLNSKLYLKQANEDGKYHF
jgi:hypothetical protein